VKLERTTEDEQLLLLAALVPVDAGGTGAATGVDGSYHRLPASRRSQPVKALLITNSRFEATRRVGTEWYPTVVHKTTQYGNSRSN